MAELFHAQEKVTACYRSPRTMTFVMKAAALELAM